MKFELKSWGLRILCLKREVQDYPGVLPCPVIVAVIVVHVHFQSILVQYLACFLCFAC